MIDHTVQCNTMMKIEEAILDERRWPAGAVTVIIRFERGAATQNDKWPGSLVWTAGAGRRVGLPSAPHLALPCMTGSREGWLNRAPRPASCHAIAALCGGPVAQPHRHS